MALNHESALRAAGRAAALLQQAAELEVQRSRGIGNDPIRRMQRVQTGDNVGALGMTGHEYTVYRQAQCFRGFVLHPEESGLRLPQPLADLAILLRVGDADQ